MSSNRPKKFTAGAIIASDRGFTIIEVAVVIAVISIMAAMAALIVSQTVEQTKFDATVQEMNNLKTAMLGNPELIQGGARTNFGYVGDMGTLPANLTTLVERGGLPVFQRTGGAGGAFALPDLGPGAGWRGPYIDDKKDDTGAYLATLDEWGSGYNYNSATGQITSGGPDGLIGTAGDNIVIPETSVASKLAGNVTGQVRGNQGNSVQGATVTLYYPDPASPGNHRTTTCTTDANGRYNTGDPTCAPTAAIPIGRHTLRVISGIAPNQVIVDDTVVVDGDQTQTKDIVIADMIPPAAPGTPTAARASFGSLRLTWTPSTSPDIANYRIYRGTTPGSEVLYVSGVTGTTYIDPPVGSLPAKTTYYYKLSAVDNAGNESALTAEFLETVNPIQQTAATVFLPAGGAATSYTGSVTNYDSNTNIAITQVRITWNGSAATTLRDVRIGATTYNAPALCSSPCTVTGIARTYNSMATDNNFRIRFFIATDVHPATNPAYFLRVEFNPVTFDGQFDAGF